MADGHVHSHVAGLTTPKKRTVKAPDAVELKDSLHATKDWLDQAIMRLVDEYNPDKLGYKADKEGKVTSPENPTPEQMVAADIFVNCLHMSKNFSGANELALTRKNFDPKHTVSMALKRGPEAIEEVDTIAQRTGADLSDIREALATYIGICRKFHTQQVRYDAAQAQNQH